MPTVPCNNDLLAANVIDPGDRLWLIDYEYSGNNDPFFEIGNLWSEAKARRTTSGASSAPTSVIRSGADRASPALGPDEQVRLDAVGLDPRRHQ